MEKSTMPVIYVYRDAETGKLWCKTNEKGAKWHKNLKDLGEVAKATKHLPRPVEIDYVSKEEI
jgi:hypothetical protein